MRTSNTARKVVAGVSAVVVTLLLVGGTAATVTSDDAGRGVHKTASSLSTVG